MTTAITGPDTSKLDQESNAIVSAAKSLEIVTNDHLLSAGEFLKRIKRAKNVLDETFNDPIRKAHEAHKAMVAAKKQHETPLSDAERVVKRKMGDYTAEQERLRREEEARLREIERQKEEERRLVEAERLEAAGETESADAVLDAPPAPVPVVVPKTTPKVDGVSYRTIWKHRIVEPNAIPRQWLIPDEKAIGAHARSMKDRASIPGVEFYSEQSVAAGF